MIEISGRFFFPACLWNKTGVMAAMNNNFIDISQKNELIWSEHFIKSFLLRQAVVTFSLSFYKKFGHIMYCWLLKEL